MERYDILVGGTCCMMKVANVIEYGVKKKYFFFTIPFLQDK
jgi:hypothetical protein